MVASVRKTMRSSVPCSSWIDSFSLLDIQVVSLMRDYYISLVCQVDFARNIPSSVAYSFHQTEERAVRGVICGASGGGTVQRPPASASCFRRHWLSLKEPI